MRVVHIGRTSWRRWRNLMEECASLRVTRGSGIRSARAQHVATTRLPPPTLRHGVPRLALTAPLWYAVVGVHLHEGEQLLRDRKRATSAWIPPTRPIVLDIVEEAVGHRSPDRLPPPLKNPGAHRETVCHVSPPLAMGVILLLAGVTSGA